MTTPATPRFPASNLALKNTLHISREKLPQISTEDLPAFLQYLKKGGVSYQVTVEKAGNLKPSQEMINKNIVTGLEKDRPKSLHDKPIVISQDNRILDGHHRWAAIKDEEGANATVKIIRINLPIEKLIQKGNHFSGAYHKGMAEVIKLAPILKKIVHERVRRLGAGNGR